MEAGLQVGSSLLAPQTAGVAELVSAPRYQLLNLSSAPLRRLLRPLVLLVLLRLLRPLALLLLLLLLIPLYLLPLPFQPLVSHPTTRSLLLDHPFALLLLPTSAEALQRV